MDIKAPYFLTLGSWAGCLANMLCVCVYVWMTRLMILGNFRLVGGNNNGYAQTLMAPCFLSLLVLDPAGAHERITEVENIYSALRVNFLLKYISSLK